MGHIYHSLYKKRGLDYKAQRIARCMHHEKDIKDNSHILKDKNQVSDSGQAFDSQRYFQMKKRNCGYLDPKNSLVLEK